MNAKRYEEINCDLGNDQTCLGCDEAVHTVTSQYRDRETNQMVVWGGYSLCSCGDSAGRETVDPYMGK